MPSFTVTPLARKFGPWSFSKMETAESCPAQFGHKHVTKTAAAPAPSDTKVGIVAHAILERRIKGEQDKDARRAAIEKDPLTTQEQDSLRTLGEAMDEFLKRFDVFCKREGVTRVLCEEDWGFTETYGKTGFFDKDVFFRGKLDLGAITRDNDLYLIDHKSGRAKPLDRDQKKRQQLQAYAVLALANLPDVAGVRGGINFLQGDENLRLQFNTYTPADRVRAVFAPWLYMRINAAAENLEGPLEARPATRWPCAWCQYQAVCEPYKRMIANAEV
jgi:hypothetical protein